VPLKQSSQSCRSRVRFFNEGISLNSKRFLKEDLSLPGRLITGHRKHRPQRSSSKSGKFGCTRWGSWRTDILSARPWYRRRRPACRSRVHHDPAGRVIQNSVVKHSNIQVYQSKPLLAICLFRNWHWSDRPSSTNVARRHVPVVRFLDADVYDAHLQNVTEQTFKISKRPERAELQYNSLLFYHKSWAWDQKYDYWSWRMRSRRKYCVIFTSEERC
jgi:hypothetical protein